VHYIFKADEGAASSVADGDELKLVAPRAWVAKDSPRLSESSFDLHCGLDVIGDGIDTIPAELLDDLFKL